MLPRTIENKLSELRRREVLLRAGWGAARWLALVPALLFAACVIDYVIDRWRDTPWSVRVLLFAVQVVAAVVAGWFWIIRPVKRQPSQRELALWVEEALPDFRHRLITAVELNRAGARTEGMSPELIAEVTREAKKQAARSHFAGVADGRRLGWALGLAMPLLVAALLVLLLVPVAPALVGRQCLFDIGVPRSVYLESSAPKKIALSGEAVVLEFHVTGKGVTDALEGEVRLDPVAAHLPSEWYPLEFSRKTADGAIYRAKVPEAAEDFSYSAFLGDGRRTPAGAVRYVPRPVVTKILAWTLLPESCGLKPPLGSEDKISRRYDVPQPQADVIAIPGSAVRVQVRTQRAVTRAELKVLGSDAGLIVPLQLDSTGKVASGVFSLTQEMKTTGYEILVIDDNGFPNAPLPRRSIQIVPEEPPHVTLLPVSFPAPGVGEVREENVVQGMPIYPGLSIPVAYACQGRYGLDHARLLYRFPKKDASGEEPAEEQPWTPLALPEVLRSDKTGAFLPGLGRFEKSGPKAQVHFHAVPSPNPYTALGRIQGGGRFRFQTERLFDRDKIVELRPGDQVEVCVEVFAGKPGEGRPSARSETRVFSVMTRDECRTWALRLFHEQKRLEDLRQQQEGVFGK